jgi:DNA-binding SARP family transcriptional activator
VHEKGRYRINPSVEHRYDVAEFQRLARLGRTQNEAAHIARAEAIALYRSPFLEMCDHEWCDELRQALHNEMMDILLLEAHYLADAAQVQDAEPLYVRMLGFDSYDERAHRGVMWCRAQRNDRTGALRQFRECRRILQDELDAEPGPQTLRLHQAILSGQPGPLPN